MVRMRSWDDYSHAERAIFISHLNQYSVILDSIVPADDLKHHAVVQKLLSDDEAERRAIQAESLRHRTFGQIYDLEDLCFAALDREERFAGEHEVARALIAKDVPRWRVIARGIASGLGVK